MTAGKYEFFVFRSSNLPLPYSDIAFDQVKHKMTLVYRPRHSLQNMSWYTLKLLVTILRIELLRSLLKDKLKFLFHCLDLWNLSRPRS
jgi:hypothetical protein